MRCETLKRAISNAEHFCIRQEAIDSAVADQRVSHTIQDNSVQYKPSWNSLRYKKLFWKYVKSAILLRRDAEHY